MDHLTDERLFQRTTIRFFFFYTQYYASIRQTRAFEIFFMRNNLLERLAVTERNKKVMIMAINQRCSRDIESRVN